MVEAEIMSGVRGEVPNLTVGELIGRYVREVVPKKKGAHWEEVRCKALQRDSLASVRLRHLDSPHVAAWQERRLSHVSQASVRRERNLLNAAFEIARKEWKWVRRNPFDGVRRPKDAKARTRVATQGEIDAILKLASPEMQKAIVLALETGMRASELTRFEAKGRVGYLADTKNDSSREVALSSRALEAMASGPVGISAGSISTLWAQYCKAAKVKGLTFHDLRRTAAVRLADKLSPLELAKMLGHKDLRMTLNVYYQADPEKVADKLG